MLREFFDWWFSQLKSLLPAGLKSRMRQELCLLYLDLNGQQLAAHASFRNETFNFGDIPLDEDADEHPQLQSFIRELPRRPDRIVLRLARGRYLSREVELPLAAEENLSDAIAYQLDHLTPFSADQVLYFCGVKERIPAHKKLRAWLAVTPTAQVDQALQVLGGTPPTPMRMPRQAPRSDGPLEIVFRPFGQSDSRGFSGTLALAGLLLLLLIGAFSLHVNNRIETREQLGNQLAQLRAEASDAAQAREVLQQLRDQAGQLQKLQPDQPRITALWNDLTERLDSQTWIQRIDLRDGKLTLQGISDNAAALIATLEASPHLRDVSFASSVTRDRVSSKDRFNISARVIEPVQGSAS